MWETLENGDLFMDCKNAWLLITVGWECIINYTGNGYLRFSFPKTMTEGLSTSEKQSILLKKYDELEKLLNQFTNNND